MPESPLFRLIVGLGNPGREYRDTRHNVGFMIVDRLAAAARAELRTEKAWRAELSRACGVFLCKPLTYMNQSGKPVQAVSQFYKIASFEILVVVDDMALPLGKLRLRASGSSGGHNGLQSIIDELGTEALPRLRIGIGCAEPGGATGHVLGRFAPEERAEIEESLERAANAIQCAQTQGLAAAMSAYN